MGIDLLVANCLQPECWAPVCPKCGRDVVPERMLEHICGQGPVHVHFKDQYTGEKFKSSRGLRKLLAGTFLMSDEQVARDNAIGSEYDTPLRSATDFVDKMMIPAIVPEEKQKKTQVVKADEEVHERATSLYRNIDPDAITFIKKYFVAAHIKFPPAKEGEFSEYEREFPVRRPSDLVPTAPYIDGVGPEGGLNELNSFSGYLTLRTPEDLKELEVFDTAHAGMGPEYRKKRIKIIKNKNGDFVEIRDTRLVLTVAAEHGIEITHGPKASRYHPRNPDKAKTRKPRKPKEQVCLLTPQAQQSLSLT